MKLIGVTVLICIVSAENKLLDMGVDSQAYKNRLLPVLEQNPAFTAIQKAAHPTLSGSNNVVRFDNVILNRGKGYDPATGIFTAPKTGLYQISVTVMSNGGSALNVSLRKNGVPILNMYGSPLHGSTETANPILELQTGDRVYVEGAGEINGDSYCYISGFYISE